MEMRSTYSTPNVSLIQLRSVLPASAQDPDDGTTTIEVLPSSSDGDRCLNVVHSVRPDDVTNDISAESEMDLLRHLDHRNIIKLVDIMQGGSFCTAPALGACGCQDLRTRLGGKCLSEPNAADAFRQLAGAVDYLHRKRICHRNIHAGNILFPGHDTLANVEGLKLAGFQYACYVEEGVALTERIGHLKYMAPEMLSRKYSLPCDIWACGVILFLMISGQVPFRHDSASFVTDAHLDIARKIRSARFFFNPLHWAHVSTNGKELIRSMFMLKDRCTASDLLQHPWLAASTCALSLIPSSGLKASSPMSASISPSAPILPGTGDSLATTVSVGSSDTSEEDVGNIDWSLEAVKAESNSLHLPNESCRPNFQKSVYLLGPLQTNDRHGGLGRRIKL